MDSLGRILLAEDDPRDVELTLAALADNHLANQVVVARDGEEVLDHLERCGRDLPVLIVLDIKMPKIDGIEVLARLKSDPRLRIVPVVMLTSSRDTTDLQKCYDLGVNAYVVKPVRFSEFVDAVKQVGAFWAVTNQVAGREPA